MNGKESAIYLPKGPLVGLPPAGTMGLYVDSSGTFKSIDETGATSIINPGVATSTANGLLSSAGFSQLQPSVTLTDASVSVTPFASHVGVFILPANTLTVDRTLTFPDEAGATSLLQVTVVVHPQTHNLIIKNALGTTIWTAAPAAGTLGYVVIWNTGHYLANTSSILND